MVGLSNNLRPSLICHSHSPERADEQRNDSFEVENSENSVVHTVNSRYMSVKPVKAKECMWGFGLRLIWFLTQPFINQLLFPQL